MPHYFDCLCIGNVKIDEFLSIHHAASHVRLNQETNELCVKYGEKIPVDSCLFLLGGNACNVSVGLSRLGIGAGLMVEIGDDEFSQKIINGLALEKVDTTFVQQTKGSASSFSVILNFKNERTIFSQHTERAHNFSFNDVSAKWVYLTSLGNKWQNAYAEVLNFVKQTGAKLAFNPGTLQLKKGYADIKNVLKITDILFVNKEEAITILNIKNQTSNRELLVSLQQLGPKIVVITDGENGSFAIDEKREILKQGIVEIKVVEKTGVGDAYSSGFLGALITGHSLAKAMDWGTKNSTSVIQKIGAQPGLLNKSEIENYD